MGTKAHRLTTAAMTLDDDGPADPPPKVQPKTAKAAADPAPPPQPVRKPASVFSLGDL